MTMQPNDSTTLHETAPSVVDGPGWGVVMALYALDRRVTWDQFLELCRVAGYATVPMGFFEETWQARPRSDGKPAETLLRGGKTAEYAELNDAAPEWIATRTSADILKAVRRLPALLAVAAAWGRNEASTP